MLWRILFTLLTKAVSMLSLAATRLARLPAPWRAATLIADSTSYFHIAQVPHHSPTHTWMDDATPLPTPAASYITVDFTTTDLVAVAKTQHTSISLPGAQKPFSMPSQYAFMSPARVWDAMVTALLPNRSQWPPDENERPIKDALDIALRIALFVLLAAHAIAALAGNAADPPPLVRLVFAIDRG